MFGLFSRVTDSSDAFEGGSSSSLRYRHKCNFDKPRPGSRLNKNHMQCARCVKALLVVVNALMNFLFIFANIAQGYNPLSVIIVYYSLWGCMWALFSHIFSMIACNREGWFRVAYITTEISFAVNSVIMLVFWIILWPMVLQGTSGGTAPETFLRWYQGILHFVPFLTTVSDLYMTDMALEKSHWWITFIAFFPCYMCCNWWGAMTIGNMTTRKKGSVYGPEMWDTNVPLTIFYFFCIACFQALLFYCAAVIIDKVWPKRADEYFFEGGKDSKDDEKAEKAIQQA